MLMGRVYIVGAGPGDPELITVKGLKLLERADVVLHDRLVSRELLRRTKPGAVVVDVGKQPGGVGR
jgi:uroporphyrin-III C-methyltransferase